MDLSRSRLLLTLALSAIVLLVIAQIWRSLAGIELPVVFSWLALGQGVGLGLAIGATSFAVYQWWPTYRESADQYMEMVLTPLSRFDRVWLGLLPGLSEELLFRGVALPAIGLVASSLLFGLLHIWDWRHWPYALWATLIGLVLGVATLVSGNLVVPVVAHVLVNWLSCLLWRKEPSRV
ncbi:MAG: CPBP family intramembrane metalloprotease [Aphanocapsa lilacina HA4352-LM1]|jgi:membrane protease YdiL (CAAX protease family)|nr:CPBP family intramembrane metalloprotease [Aphanocapsa lilacina HA4352-LM1]